MKKSQNNLTDAELLRQKAEEQLKKKQTKVSSLYSENDLRKLAHELQVHEIELEMQYEQLKHAKEESDSATQKYTELYDFAPSGYFTLTKQGEIIGVNFHGASLLGKERLHLINRRFSSSVSDQTKPIFNNFLNKVFETKGDESCELTLSVESKNVPTYVYLTGHVLENGEQCQIDVVDITERKKLIAQIQTSKDFLANIINSVGAPVFVKDDKHKFCLVNTALCLFLNLSAEELIGKTGYENFPKEQFDEFIAKDREVFETSMESSNEEFITNGYGEIRTIITKKTLYTDVYDNKFLVGIINDITERKKAEEEMKQSYLFNETLLKTIPFGMDIVDETGTVLFQSNNFKEIFGKSAIGNKCWELYKDDKKQCDDCPLNKGIIIGEHETYEAQGVLGNRIIEIYHTGMMYDGKKAMLEIFQDITERKEYEANLIRAKEKAEESDHLKSAFLSNMSHEIRTPMNGILGFTELLKEPNLSTDDQQDFIQTIQISGERMLNTINNIVDVSKIEAGLSNVFIDETNINQKIEFTYKFFKPEVERKGLQFRFKNGLPTKDAIIKTDNEKVYGILTNLVKNAIKFTYDGSIELGYILKSDREPAELEFYVKDTGVGIPKNQKEFIFERFRQGSNDNSRMYEGSGLGLAIAKSYVEMLGGMIWVESEEGKGSTFYFTITYHSVDEEKAEIKDIDSSENKKVQTKNLKILIVEDDEISYSLLKRTIQKIGKEVLRAITGIQAIEACRSNPDLDLILMDIRMPIMDGVEATRQIRKFNKDVIIFAQTAYAFNGDREIALAAGCNDYISKPINMALMFELIKKHYNN